MKRNSQPLDSEAGYGSGVDVDGVGITVEVGSGIQLLGYLQPLVESCEVAESVDFRGEHGLAVVDLDHGKRTFGW